MNGRSSLLVLAFLILSFHVMPEWVFAGQASLGPAIAIAQQTQMIVKESTDAGEQQKEEFFRKLQTKLDEFDIQLEELTTQGDTLREKARNEFLERLDQLQLQKNNLLPKIEKATRMSEAAWEDLKAGLDRAATELKVALEQAVSKFF
jgi:uncharacterized protein (DUF342 family)